MELLCIDGPCEERLCVARKYYGQRVVVDRRDQAILAEIDERAALWACPPNDSPWKGDYSSESICVLDEIGLWGPCFAFP